MILTDVNLKLSSSFSDKISLDKYLETIPIFVLFAAELAADSWSWNMLAYHMFNQVTSFSCSLSTPCKLTHRTQVGIKKKSKPLFFRGQEKNNFKLTEVFST